MSTGNAQVPPLFIVGPPRSGTTLVMRILDSHSRIAVYPESHYYHFFHADRHRYGDLRRPGNLESLLQAVRLVVQEQGRMDAPSLAELRDRLVAPTFEGVLTTLLRVHAENEGKVRSADKTPGHYAYLPEIREGFPASPILFVVRDPRDTVLSNREAFGTRLETSVWSWNDALASHEEATGPVHLVRYEDLVAAPVPVVEGICRFLEEPFERDMLRFYENDPTRPDELLPHHRKLFGPVEGGSVGRFRSMTQAEIERIEATCGAGMRALGYALVSAASSGARVERPTPLRRIVDRACYYGVDRGRWRRGWLRWRLALRARARHATTFGWIRP